MDGTGTGSGLGLAPPSHASPGNGVPRGRHGVVYNDAWNGGRTVNVAVHTMFEDGGDGRAYLELGGT